MLIRKMNGTLTHNVLRVYVRVFCDLKQINMECKRCGAYSYSRKSSLCSKCKYDLKIEKAVENARMRAKNLHIHAVIPALQHSDAMCFHECPNCNDRCYCSAQPCSCCTQDEPDYKGLYEHRTAQFNELLAKYENQTPSRNWVAECAIAFVSTKGLGFEDAWDWAEQWAAEGKRRGHI